MTKKTPLRVKFVADQDSTGRGVGFYSQFLCEALMNHPDIELVDRDPDVIHYPHFDLFYPTLPLYHSTPTVVTIHDLTPLVLPSLYPRGVKGTLSLIRQRLALTTVKSIITDSKNSKQDIHKIFAIQSKKIFVTPLAIDPYYTTDHKFDAQAVRDKYNLPKRFVLTLAGGPNPNKNLPRLARVTAKLGITLVIVGGGMTQEVTEPVHSELRDLARVRKFLHVITPGFVPTPDFYALYKMATAYVQASLYEGFGMPVLEAMSTGCLLVSSHTSSLPELYAPGTITFDPNNFTDMLRKLRRALRLTPQARQSLIEANLGRSRDFTWEETVGQTIEAYRSAVAQKNTPI
jgi:glycosyltransferase involved in cell wall biosynthesis